MSEPPEKQLDLDEGDQEDLYPEGRPTLLFDGVYLTDFMVQGEVEALWRYRAGGYHPIHFGDVLNERYEVMHKLGHGTFGTVWICHDQKDQQYVAVKVHVADLPRNNVLDLDLAALDLSAAGAEYINVPKDNFTLKGPNGEHLCLVSKVFGSSVTPGIWFDLENPYPKLKNICLQVTKAMSFLHQNDICHGDFRASNILLQMESFDHLSKDEVFELLGNPKTSIAKVHVKSAHERPSSVPKYIVYDADLKRLQKYFKDKICIIDFGEAYHTHTPTDFLGIPEDYLPSEILLEVGSPGISCDLWALGCAIFEIMFQSQLFDSFWSEDKDKILASIVYKFGKLPLNIWKRWEGRSTFFEEDGTPLVQERIGGIPTLEMRMAQESEMSRGGPLDKKRTFKVPEEDQRQCKDLLSKIMKLNPAERLSAAEVLNHEWFASSNI